MPGRRLLHAPLLIFVFASLLALAQRAHAQAADGDGDGLPDAWEVRFGLDPASAASPNGAADDPDGDGLTNRREFDQGGHPRGLHRRWLAEGASNGFFSWRLALANPEGDDAHVSSSRC